MDQILSNKMLVGNAVWIAPGMYLTSYFIDHNFEVLAAGNIGPLNGLFRAIILGGKPFITIANADYIPFPPFGYHEVKLWADSWDGDNDPIQWPQPYLSFNSHFHAILCPNSLLNHQIIWWMLSLSDFVSHMSTLSPLSGLGKISESQYTALHTSVPFSFNIANNITPPQSTLLLLFCPWSSGCNMSSINYAMFICLFVMPNSLSTTYREYGSIFGLCSITWKYSNLR